MKWKRELQLSGWKTISQNFSSHYDSVICIPTTNICGSAKGKHCGISLSELANMIYDMNMWRSLTAVFVFLVSFSFYSSWLHLWVPIGMKEQRWKMTPQNLRPKHFLMPLRMQKKGTPSKMMRWLGYYQQGASPISRKYINTTGRFLATTSMRYVWEYRMHLIGKNFRQDI